MRILLIAVSFICMGCSLFLHRLDEPSDLKGKISEITITHDSRERSFVYYEPVSLGKSPMLLFVLHGSKGSGRLIREMTGYQFDWLAETENIIPVYPNGFGGHWNGCRKGASDSAHQLNVDDVGFVQAMIDYFAGHYSIDPSRVYAAGFSNGGHMCFRLAVEIPDQVKAFAAIAAHVPVPENSRCLPPFAPVSMMLVSGTEDPINPYQGGMVSILGLIDKGEVRSAVDSAVYWLKSAEPDEPEEVHTFPDINLDDASHVQFRQWKGAGSATVRLYTVYGGGHTIPGGTGYYPAFIVGRTNQDIVIAEEIIHFFKNSRDKFRRPTTETPESGGRFAIRYASRR